MARRFGAVRTKRSRNRTWLEASYLTPVWAFAKWPGLKDRQYANFESDEEYAARSWLHDAKLRIEAGVWEPEVEVRRDEIRGTLTFGQYFEQWMASRRTKDGAQLEPGTAYRLRKDCENHVLPHFSGMRLSEITSRDVERWWDSLDHSQAGMCINSLKVLKAVLRTASSPGSDGESPLITANPCHIKTPKPERESQTIPATVKEVETIHDAMPDGYRETIYIAVFCNGPRIGEVCAFQRKNVDLDHLTLHIRASRKTIGAKLVGKTKTTNGMRDETIPPQLKPMFEQLLQRTDPEPDAWLFPAPRDHTEPIHPNVLRGWYNKAARQSNRPDLRFHDLRHTALTLLAQQGATVRELMDAAGHADPTMAMRYQHTVQSRSQDLARRIGNLIPTPDTEETLRSRIWENHLEIERLHEANEALGLKISALLESNH
ncbi:MAG: site-specific integrase [Bifidobacterium sp.]|nr:site-specific integrase [Bifidobacterium sp.]